MLSDLKQQVFRANLRLKEEGLVVLTWGNVSAIDREKKLVVIKPSGVSYNTMSADDMVVCDLEGNVVEGKLKPSVDVKTHLELYKHFPNIAGVVHNHSTYATSFAQSEIEIIPLGTTHADAFYGNIPCTRQLTEKQVRENYAEETGVAIVERFQTLDYTALPGVLVARHGVFSWGKSADDAVNNAVVIEECAKMAFLTLSLNKDAEAIPDYLLDTHYKRKHGKNRTYGQE